MGCGVFVFHRVCVLHTHTHQDEDDVSTCVLGVVRVYYRCGCGACVLQKRGLVYGAWCLCILLCVCLFYTHTSECGQCEYFMFCVVCVC